MSTPARVSRYTPTMLSDDQEIAQIRKLSWYALVSCKRKIAKMDMNLPGMVWKLVCLETGS